MKKNFKIGNVKYTAEYRETKIGDTVIKDDTVFEASIMDADDLNWVVETKEDIKDVFDGLDELDLTTTQQTKEDDLLSAGICDTCAIPTMVNTGNGVDEPPDPILYCHKMVKSALSRRKAKLRNVSFTKKIAYFSN